MLKNKVLLVLLFAGLSISINAQVVVSKYAGEFLSIGVGGRGAAMGGAMAASVNDVTAGYWNPAGLAFIDYPQVALMHEEHFGELINYNYASVAIPYGKDMSFGVSLMRLSVDAIPDTREALIDAVTSQVIYDITNPNARLDPSKITEFNNTDWALYLSFAKRHWKDFYFGANVKIIKRDIAEFSATGIGFDIGAVYMPVDDLYLAANIQDVTTTLVAWDTGRNELISPTVKLGTAYKLNIIGGVLTPAIDLDMRFEGREYAANMNLGPVSIDHHFGIEYDFQNLIAVRAGYNDVKQFSVGAGIYLPKLAIDYSFARMSDPELERLPDSHRISVILTLEEPRFMR